MIFARDYTVSLTKILENFNTNQDPVYNSWNIYIAGCLLGVREKSERSEELDIQVMNRVMGLLDVFPGVVEIEVASIKFFSRFLKFYINHNWNPHEMKEGPKFIAGIDLQ